MLEVVRDWLSVGAAVICAWGVIVVWVKSPGEKVARSLTELRKAIDDLEDAMREDLKAHDRRIQATEGDLKHMPSADEVSGLKNAVTRLESDVSHMGETLKSVNHTVLRIDDYLRENR